MLFRCVEVKIEAVASVLECLLSLCEALDLIPAITKMEKNDKLRLDKQNGSVC